MSEPRVTVQAADAAAARELASQKLQASPEHIELAEAGDGAWNAVVRGADARIQVGLSQDEMQAKIASYTPPVGDGRALCAESVTQALEAARVEAAPDAEAISQVLKRAASGKDPTGMIVAQGTAVVAGTNGTIEPLGDLHAPVLPGNVFARIAPAQQPQPGRTVTGKEVVPQETDEVTDVTPALQGECAITEDKEGIYAKTYGLASVQANRVSVEPLIAVGADRMEVRATLYPQAFDGTEIGLAEIRRMLEAEGIQAEPSIESLDPILSEIRESGKPELYVVLCAGVPPEAGEDGRLELLVETAQSVGAERNDGSVDFRERSTFHNVAADTLLARLIPPTGGTPGRDVFGSEVPAKAGEAAAADAGDNVEVSADGSDFRAKTDGIVRFAANALSVTDVLEISGDVDMSTGNIRMDKGSVSVKGTVRNGFSVACSGNLVVGESIESATVEAGGDVEVKRGILMQEGGVIKAKGNVSAHFAQNARIEAGGDVVIDNDITNCEITAGQKVIAQSGKGRIQGGAVRSGFGIEVNEIGSELGAETVVEVGLETEAEEELARERKDLERAVRKISAALGDGEPREVLLRAPAAKRKAIAALLKSRIGAQERLKEIESSLVEEQARKREQAKGRIKAKRVIHPGVAVMIAGCQMKVKRSITASQLYFEASENAIAAAPY